LGALFDVQESDPDLCNEITRGDFEQNLSELEGGDGDNVSPFADDGSDEADLDTSDDVVRVIASITNPAIADTAIASPESMEPLPDQLV
jgi:hypothetical protein